MEHRFKKTLDGYQAQTEDDLLLFGVLLSEELQQLEAVEALQQLLAQATQQPMREQLWRGRHYTLSILQGEATLAHMSDGVNDEEYATQMDSNGFGEVQQVSVAGLADLDLLLNAWHDFISGR